MSWKHRVPLADRPVHRLMKRDVVTVSPGESVLEADRIMRLARIRHLPVTRDGVLVGILSHRDVLEVSLGHAKGTTPEERSRHLSAIPIEQILRGSARTVEPDSCARDAALLMLRLKIGCVPVVQPGPKGPELLGLIAESDLLRLAYVPGFTGASD